MSVTSVHQPSLLLCSSNMENMRPLRQQLQATGVHVECCTQAIDARRKLWNNHFDGIAVDLLLADRDGISFALELREEHPRTPVLVISTTGSDCADTTADNWLDHSGQYARLIFALKQASQRSAGRHPSILHVEHDDRLAGLVRNTIGQQARLFRARSPEEAQIALSLRQYDLALIRPDALTATQAAGIGDHPLQVPAGQGKTSVLTILENLRPPAFIHQPAYC